MSHYTALWLAWIAAFFVIEFAALIKHRGQGYTLSEHVWAWFGTGPITSPVLLKTRRVMLLTFVCWLAVHFMGGGRLV